MFPGNVQNRIPRVMDKILYIYIHTSEENKNYTVMMLIFACVLIDCGTQHKNDMVAKLKTFDTFPSTLGRRIKYLRRRREEKL